MHKDTGDIKAHYTAKSKVSLASNTVLAAIKDSEGDTKLVIIAISFHSLKFLAR